MKTQNIASLDLALLEAFELLMAVSAEALLVPRTTSFALTTAALFSGR